METLLYIVVFMFAGCVTIGLLVKDLWSKTDRELSDMDGPSNMSSIVLVSLGVGGFFSFMGGMFLW